MPHDTMRRHRRCDGGLIREDPLNAVGSQFMCQETAGARATPVTRFGVCLRILGVIEQSDPLEAGDRFVCRGRIAFALCEAAPHLALASRPPRQHRSGGLERSAPAIIGDDGVYLSLLDRAPRPQVPGLRDVASEITGQLAADVHVHASAPSRSPLDRCDDHVSDSSAPGLISVHPSPALLRLSQARGRCGSRWSPGRRVRQTR